MLVTKQNSFQKILIKIIPIFFFVFIESSETFADPSLNEIGAKLHFSSNLFVIYFSRCILGPKTELLESAWTKRITNGQKELQMDKKIGQITQPSNLKKSVTSRSVTKYSFPLNG